MSCVLDEEKKLRHGRAPGRIPKSDETNQPDKHTYIPIMPSPSSMCYCCRVLHPSCKFHPSELMHRLKKQPARQARRRSATNNPRLFHSVVVRVVWAALARLYHLNSIRSYSSKRAWGLHNTQHNYSNEARTSGFDSQQFLVDGKPVLSHRIYMSDPALSSLPHAGARGEGGHHRREKNNKGSVAPRCNILAWLSPRPLRGRSALLQILRRVAASCFAQKSSLGNGSAPTKESGTFLYEVNDMFKVCFIQNYFSETGVLSANSRSTKLKIYHIVYNVIGPSLGRRHHP